MSEENGSSSGQVPNHELSLPLKGKLRKKRINALKAVDAPITEDYKKTFVLADMPDEEWEKFLNKEAEAAQQRKDQAETDNQNEAARADQEKKFGEEPTEKSAREIELENEIEQLKAAKQEEKPTLNQDLLNKVLEYVIQKEGFQEKKMTSNDEMGVLKQVTDTLALVTQQQQRTTSAIPVAREQIDPSDVLDEPVFYFAYKSQYSIFGDKRQGQDLKTPYGTPIKFEKELRMVKNKNSRYEKEILAVCKAKVLSKKEMEFMESHSLKDITFFRDMNTQTTTHAAYAEVLSQVSMELSRMTQHQVVTRARDMDIAASRDIDGMKRELIHKIAKERFQQQQRNREGLAHHPTATLELRDDKGNTTGVITAPEETQSSVIG
jgi:hypothetical protein